MLDFIRIACAVPNCKVGNVSKNTEEICRLIASAEKQNVDVLVFPELSVTGYTCGDLFYQDTLIRGAEAGLAKIMTFSGNYPAQTILVGLPVRLGMKLLNCGAVISGGRLLGLVSKTWLPDYDGCCESRWFGTVQEEQEITVAGVTVPVGSSLLFRVGETVLAAEICEDLFAPVAPSALHCLNGAEVIVNLAASPEIAGKRPLRRERVQAQSESCKCVYAYCSAGFTESTTDLVYSGHSIIAENGVLLQENENYVDSGYLMVQDCDLGRIRAVRRKNTPFRNCAEAYCGGAVLVEGTASELRSDGSCYPVAKLPFIPSTKEGRMTYCKNIFQLQVTGLKQRLAAIGNANAVIGISGGLDSTLALLVAVEAMRQAGRPTTDNTTTASMKPPLNRFAGRSTHFRR